MKLRLLLPFITVAVFASAHPALASDKVRLRLNWMYYGSHDGFAYGKEKGIYEKHGIELDIRSGSAHRLVANSDSLFSYGSCASERLAIPWDIGQRRTRYS